MADLIEDCRECGKPITLLPLVGWTHWDVLEQFDHEAAPKPSGTRTGGTDA